MIAKLFCPGLLETGPVSETLLVIRDGWVNFFVVKAPGGLLCVDTGWRAANVSRSFERLGLDVKEVKAVFLTHLHWDHARCLSLFKQAELYVGEHEQPHFFIRQRVAEHSFRRLHDGQTLSVCGLDVRALATPGHTPGSVSYLLSVSKLAKHAREGHAPACLGRADARPSQDKEHINSITRRLVIGNGLLFTGDTLRLKQGSVVPSPSCFNQDGEVLKASLRKLASVQGVDCLLTAHSGFSKKPAEAFAPWAIVNNNQQGGLTP